MALEVIGGSLLSSFFQQVFQKLDSQEVKNFVRGRKQTDKLLRKLRMMLLSVNNVYDDAEDKQLTNSAVREWLCELKGAILDAEDLLDKIKTKALRRKLEAADGSRSSTSTKVGQFLFYLFRAFNESVDTKIEKIIEGLEFIAQQKDALDLKTGARQRISYTLPSTCLVEESGVYGRDEDKDAIIKLLLANDATGNKIDVIPIVGMGGIGKTTLAQLVFNDEKVTGHFNLQAWVCVSDDFDVVKITRTIYMSVPSHAKCENPNDLNELHVKLKESLTGKKFLFVLDDVWDENYTNWDLLRRPFESGACGSKIIVTTRNEGVASVMGTLQTHHLRDICDNDCWLLFAKHAFENKNVSAYPNLEVIGRNIVKKCKGLPLPAKSLGGLLRSTSNEEEWKNVLESHIWELPDKECNILPALWLSYRYLPPHLKRCFAYSSIYPKDYQFKKNDLVLLWMAEDLLQPKKKKMVEEVGEEYFNDLISRSFFQRSKDYAGRPVFIMHDLINDLAKFVSGDFCVRLDDNDSFNSKTRHFSYMTEDNLVLEKFEALYEATCLRSFLPLAGWRGESPLFRNVIPDVFLKLQCLRVLNLSQYIILELPDSVSKLIHLRYLDLSYTRIEKLPDAVCGLYNLQTLLLTSCRALAQWPTGLGSLIHLRHVDFRGAKLLKIPSEMCKWKVLQRLPLDKFALDNETNIVVLKELQELHGKLHICGLDNIVHAGDALAANMREKKYLTELVLEWGDEVSDIVDSRKDEEVLDNLRPHTNIREVTIDWYGGTNFPAWLGDDCFSNLVCVRLVNCANCFSLRALGRPALEKLEVSSCPNLVCFPDGGLHAPNLRSIQIYNCKKLRSLPEEMRTLLPSLKDITIIHCPKLESFPEGGLPCNLEELKIQYCDKLVESRMQWGLLQLTSLRHLEIHFHNCAEEIESFPDEGLLPSTLTRLEFGQLSNLKTINSNELKRLISLRSLLIVGCPELLCLPDDGLPISLSDLRIYGCPLVTQRCKEDKGEDWPKIAHIPSIDIH